MSNRLFTDPGKDRDDMDPPLESLADELDDELDADTEEEPNALLFEDEVEEVDAAEVEDASTDLLLDDNEVDENVAGGLEQFACAFCGEMNEIFVDRTASKHQQFTEDCEVCCRPNLVTIFIDPDGGTWIEAEQEYEA